MVVRGSACDAASWTSRSGTPASRAAVMNACLRVCGPTFLVIPGRRATRRTSRPAACRSRRLPLLVQRQASFAVWVHHLAFVVAHSDQAILVSDRRCGVSGG